MLMIGATLGAPAVVASDALLVRCRPLAAEEPDEPVPEHLDRERQGRGHAEHRRDEHAARSRIEVGVSRRGDRETGHENERDAKGATDDHARRSSRRYSDTKRLGPTGVAV